MIKPKVLVVDDEKPNLRLLYRLLSKDYDCVTASSGPEAIQFLQQHDIAIIITDQRMPEMCGIDLLKETAELRPHMARILLTGYTDVEALSEAINCGLVNMYLTKPWNNSELLTRVAQALDQYRNNKKHHALKSDNERLQQKLDHMRVGFVSALTELFKHEDQYNYEHSIRVKRYVAKVAGAMNLSDEDREDLVLAAELHDIAATTLLSKQEQEGGRFLPTHAERLSRVLTMIPGLKNPADIIRFIGENFDGSGYPHKLAGEQIPVLARILRVADEYDRTARPQEQGAALDRSKAIELLRRRSNIEFDPRVVATLELVLANDKVATLLN